jgi:hypothetical protein
VACLVQQLGSMQQQRCFRALLEPQGQQQCLLHYRRLQEPQQQVRRSQTLQQARCRVCRLGH